MLVLLPPTGERNLIYIFEQKIQMVIKMQKTLPLEKRFLRALQTEKNAFYGFELVLDGANARKAVIASNRTLGTEIRNWGRKLWWDENQSKLVATGTIVGFEQLGVPLGEVICMRCKTGWYVFPVPARYRGSMDVVLAVNHPDFKIICDGDTRVIDALPDRVGIVKRFPWYGKIRYLPYDCWDPVFGIPSLAIAKKPQSSCMDNGRLERSDLATVTPIFLNTYGWMIMEPDYWNVKCGVFADATREDLQFGPNSGTLQITVEPTRLVLEAPAELMRPTLQLLVKARACKIEETPNSAEPSDSGLKVIINGSPELVESTLGLLRATRRCKIK
jgi:hypothetical protein